ncbi:Zn-dependent amino-or carboxypeptidase, M28 family [Colwellia chukchiensis]|uniref:Carboxypeptidase Q n=1 Tax=Colwellia chukchiensis TaxID=641665 RepID=A0A1H7LCT2_9GAMM|nr:M20/M25/M40 family metallo-hydrolase [Colwellia chukchiensis]SEK96741.1 Zn-dependent amino-or carboxypeptidase, M28 family [Colwellia chukchiensis]
MTAKITTLMQLSLVICLSIASSFVAGQALNSEQKTQLKQLQSTALQSQLSYQLIESLTTEVGHRLMGSAGDEKAIIWAVNKMKALGFDKVWTEPVTGSYWLRGTAKAHIVAPYPHDLVVLALGGSVATAESGITANVAHFETLADLQAIPDNSLEGKIAFVSYQMTRHIDGNGYGPAVGTRVNGAVVAAQKGASALVMRSVGTDNNRIAHTGIMRYQDKVKKIPAAALSNPDADLLLNQLKRGGEVSLYLNITARTDAEVVATSANVIGEFTGSEKPDEIVALGAHLDSWDVGAGALDDGLGIGMVMAAAHHIGQLPQRPKRTIRVILFAAEEVGLLGAKQYVKDHQAELDTHVLGAEWDFGIGRIYKMTPGVGAQSLNAIRELGQYLAPLGVALSAENNGRAQSDMGALSDAGMPSINFSPDGEHYFDYHHTENDTLDKVQPEALKINTAIYTMFAYFAAQSSADFRH